MEYHVRFGITSTLVVVFIGIGISFVTSTTVAARAYRARGEVPLKHDQTLTVKGSARHRIRSDRAVWSIQVWGEARELAPAYGVLESGVERVSAFLRSEGFRPEEIELSAIQTIKHFVRDEKGNDTRQILEYSLHRQAVVTTTDVERVLAASSRVTALIQDGVQVMSDVPAYYYSDLPKLKVELLEAASKDARARADAIARHVGGRVAEVRSASMGVLQITQPYSTETSYEGMYDTTTIEKDVTGVVTATFRIETVE